MPRARNIKPGFFKNPEIVELDFSTRLLFIALWTLADRKGRLEDRPKKIKMEAFPGDNLDIDAMLDQIAATGLIERYEVGGEKLIQVTNFERHQNPHHREPASILPPPGSEPRQALGKPRSSPADSLIPDSLIPDSGANPDEEGLFDEAWSEYPKRSGGNSKRDARIAWLARVKEGHIPSDIIAGVRRYAAYCKATDKLGTEFVKQAKTFFGPGLHFLEDWSPPSKPAEPKRPEHREFPA